MQRREAKIGLRDRKVSPETERAERYQQNPHRNGLFRGGAGICGLGRAGGGRDRDRTCDPLDVNVTWLLSVASARPKNRSSSAA